MNIVEYYDQISSRPEVAALQATKNFAASQSIFYKNCQTLMNCIEYYASGEHEDLDGLKNRGRLNLYLIELLRHLHNTVAAATTLIDHERILFKQVYKGSSEFADHDSMIKQLFTENPVIQFIQRLRNFFMHCGLPPISACVSRNFNHEYSRRIVLNKSRLKDWNEWNTPAEAFLMDPSKYIESQASDIPIQHNQIDLILTITEYRNCIGDFYDWMRKQQVTFHCREIDSLDKFRLKLASENPELMLMEMRHELSSVMAGHSSIASVFEPLVCTELYINLASGRMSPRIIVTQGMKAARAIIQIPDELAIEIYNAGEQLTNAMFEKLHQEYIDEQNEEGEVSTAT